MKSITHLLSLDCWQLYKILQEDDTTVGDVDGFELKFFHFSLNFIEYPSFVINIIIPFCII